MVRNPTNGILKMQHFKKDNVEYASNIAIAVANVKIYVGAESFGMRFMLGDTSKSKSLPSASQARGVLGT